MVALRNWWDALPALEKAIRAAIGLGLLVGSAVFFLSGYVSLPARVTTVESDLSILTRVAFCRWQAEDEGLDPSICRRLMPGNFLPFVP